MMSAVAATIAGYSVHAGALRQGEVPGVKGQLILIEKDAATVATLDKILAQVGDKVEITWNYSGAPGTTLLRAEAKSSSDCVTAEEVRRVTQPKPLATNMVAAFFEAKKPGKSVLTFVVETTGGGVILKSEVEVR